MCVTGLVAALLPRSVTTREVEIRRYPLIDGNGVDGVFVEAMRGRNRSGRQTAADPSEAPISKRRTLHRRSAGDPLGGRLRGGAMPDEQFPMTKWLRLRNALVLASRKRDRRDAKQDMCDVAIARKIVLRGELNGRYIFFDNAHHRAHLMPSNIDWKTGRLFYFDGSYSGPSNLHVLNDEVFQAFVDGRSLTDPKPAGSTNTEPHQHPGSRGGRPEKFSWDDIWIETCRHIHENGVPPTTAELMRHLQQWCENQFGEQPADSTFKPKLRKLYAALQWPDEN
jgi:hypothetical protein